MSVASLLGVANGYASSGLPKHLRMEQQKKDGVAHAHGHSQASGRGNAHSIRVGSSIDQETCEAVAQLSQKMRQRNCTVVTVPVP